MTNQKSQTIRKSGPASTAAILPPVQRYAPACRADSSRRSSPPKAEAPGEGGSCRTETPPAPTSRATHLSSEALLAKEDHLSTDDHQPVHNHPQTAPRKVSRNGKIARLAKPLRDMVNLMLQNNNSHADIADAIHEHGIRVSVRNVSNWKTRGGYDDWRLEQNRIITTRLRQDNLTDYLRPADATHLPEVGLQLTATQLCEFLLAPETQQQLTSNPEKFARTISNLCRVTRHLHLLQKYRDDSARELGYRHNPERVKRETDKRLETTRQIYSAERLGDTDDEPDLPHRNFIPKNAHSHIAQDDPDGNRPAVDPLSFLSALTSSLKDASSSKPANPPDSPSPSPQGRELVCPPKCF